MVQGIIYSILAGIFVSLQGVFNTRLSEEVDLWHTNTWVHSTGFFLAVALMFIFEGPPNFTNITNVRFDYLLGGVLAVLIVFSIMKGIGALGVSHSVTILIVTQITVSMIISIFGLFGDPAVSLSPTDIIGVVLMIIGVLMYQIF
ncbi:DMT family transporter [Natranaerobius trueperi]|uniref:EamA-like transporter family protein n=1 Tax=Natranaerobius trueperi TaxID=759412 RepID=A0A226BW09_9FIRM|nr:DMT family transporter [Natranaerobius trueperi]OWZ83186.1 hypothetical protein CDO51_09810 [Natranaerobius trueperi]